MTEEAKQKKQERTQIYHDVYDNKIPKRVPVNVSLNLNVVADYAGISGKEALWHPEKLEKAADELCSMIYSDVCLFAFQILLPAKYQTMGANNMKVSNTGFMQHPNHVGFYPEDYDAFIENPYDCIVERVLPRNFQELATPGRNLFAIANAMKASNAVAGQNLAVIGRLNEKYGYYKDAVKSIGLKGIEGLAKIQSIMETLRAEAPAEVGGYHVVSARDYKMDTIKNLATGEVKPTGLPSSNVLYYDMNDDAWLCVRPSGTEPKIKFYYGVKGTSLEDADQKSAALGEAVMAMVDKML